MAIHELKILPAYFDAVLLNVKTVELRFEDDRVFAEGDVLVLREISPDLREMAEATQDASILYTGRTCRRMVTHILRDTRWLQPGIAALSIRPLDASLSRLREVTNTALQQAHGHVDGAINWGDLRCLEARHFVTDDGETGYQVIIEEASPTAANLHRFVGESLAEVGFADVEVMTSW